MVDYSRVHEASIECKKCHIDMNIVIASYHGVGKKCPNCFYVNKVNVPYLPKQENS